MSGDTSQQPLYRRVEARLRLRLDLAGTQLPGWLAESIEALRETDFIDLQIQQYPSARSRRGLYARYQRLDRRLLGGLDVVLASRGLLLPADTGQHAGPDRPVDVVLRIGLPPATSPEGRLASWSIPAEDCDPDSQGRWMLAPFIAGQFSTAVGLRVHDDARGGFLMLEPGEVALPQFCLARHRAYQLQKAPAQLLRALRRLALGAVPRQVVSPPCLHFGIGAALRLASSLLWRAASRRIGRIGRVERWKVAVRSGADRIDPARPSAAGFRILEPPRGWFWADPMPWQEQGRDFVFVEALDFAHDRGEIHVLELDGSGELISCLPILSPPIHLSYPTLFRWQGQIHLWVESAQARCVSNFRALRFPDRWEPLPPILPGWRAVDATPFEHQGRWWLFACISESPFDDGGREWNELFLFHADSPAGPWNPHAQNPVCTDVRRARPAGPVFVHEGRLIRPGQDCAREYGHALVFNEITELDPERYSERALATLQPDWQPDLHGCHTYARHGCLEVLDVKQLAPRHETRAALD